MRIPYFDRKRKQVKGGVPNEKENKVFLRKEFERKRFEKNTVCANSIGHCDCIVGTTTYGVIWREYGRLWKRKNRKCNTAKCC